MSIDFKYSKLRAGDVLCTSARSPVCAIIRLRTAHLKKRNGFIEMFRCRIANHCAVIVEMGKRFWLAEMCADGLKINSMRKYLNNKKEKIVAIKRHHKMTQPETARQANDRYITMAHEMRDYDYDMFKAYFRLGEDNPKEFYCSELCESIANEFNTTWDHYQLKNSDPQKSLIAPVEIHFGSPEYSEEVTDFYTTG